MVLYKSMLQLKMSMMRSMDSNFSHAAIKTEDFCCSLYFMHYNYSILFCSSLCYRLHFVILQWIPQIADTLVHKPLSFNRGMSSPTQSNSVVNIIITITNFCGPGTNVGKNTLRFTLDKLYSSIIESHKINEKSTLPKFTTVLLQIVQLLILCH